MNAPRTLPTERCQRCHYWREDKRHTDPSDPDFAFGSCRRAAPRIIGEIARVIMPAPEYGNQVEPEISTVAMTTATLFPATHSADWCGEYMPVGGWPPL